MTSDDEVVCTNIDQDWGEERPNPLMHPPCSCPRCAPIAVIEGSVSWLQVAGQKQRLKVDPVELGQAGHATLG